MLGVLDEEQYWFWLGLLVLLAVGLLAVGLLVVAFPWPAPPVTDGTLGATGAGAGSTHGVVVYTVKLAEGCGRPRVTMPGDSVRVAWPAGRTEVAVVQVRVSPTVLPLMMLAPALNTHLTVAAQHTDVALVASTTLK